MTAPAASPFLSSRNIVLVGFMGTGKSSAGRRVAGLLGRDFVDVDALIEAREGRDIPRIFAEAGEPHFRSIERALVQELAGRQGLVIAPGGGIVLNPQNVADFQRTGVVICLKARPETILARVGHETHRPLLQAPDKLARITDLLGKRQPLYDAIPLAIETDGLNAGEVAERIMALFRQHCAG